MNRIQTYFMLCLSLLCLSHLQSQNTPVKYTFDFEFRDGVYQTFDEFKLNSPTITDYIIVTENLSIMELFKTNILIKRIEYFDTEGKLQSLKPNEIWGLSRDGKAYILVDACFQKLLKIGSIIYFMSMVEQVTANSSAMGTTGFGAKTILVRCLLDYSTGEILAYNYATLLSLFERDSTLYHEFMSIKGKKKRKYQMFNYIDKFNGQNPIYFPVFD